MLKIILTVGIPACGKSTWAKEEVKKDPEKVTRINRDDLRVMMSNYHYSPSNEQLVTTAKEFMIRQALRYGRDIIIDETNLNRRNFDDVVKIVKEMNLDCMVMEKPFYIELEEAIARDKLRPGAGYVGESVVEKFWKKSGGKQHKHYKPRVEICQRQTEASVAAKETEHNPSLTNAIVCDLDGTISLFNSKRSDGSVDVRHSKAHTRSPYDATKCDQDMLNEPVAAVIEAMYKSGYRIIFCSGREDLYREQTERFLNKHLSVQYELHMRKAHDTRKDNVIKGEIYDSKIAPFYNVSFVLDDRDQVVQFWRSRGLQCWQVAPGAF
jgi:predicted kinase